MTSSICHRKHEFEGIRPRKRFTLVENIYQPIVPHMVEQLTTGQERFGSKSKTLVVE